MRDGCDLNASKGGIEGDESDSRLQRSSFSALAPPGAKWNRVGELGELAGEEDTDEDEDEDEDEEEDNDPESVNEGVGGCDKDDDLEGAEGRRKGWKKGEVGDEADDS
ncbi:hypothetical protein BGZ65_004265 [Modicella reniformis]|uniref:Uncharacterized protein n=1 Tax=Modicella reniformis TaxID=1440133 RepID=A0A9P6STH6_9FUNG|nr:hypothetical protein BGZ65_004265 [Modicella reniformis]